MRVVIETYAREVNDSKENTAKPTAEFTAFCPFAPDIETLWLKWPMIAYQISGPDFAAVRPPPSRVSSRSTAGRFQGNFR